MLEGARQYFRREGNMIFDREFAVNAGARYRKLLLAGTALAGAVLLPSVAHAQQVWGGTGSTTTTNDYNLNTNWDPPVFLPPIIPGQSAQFGDGTGGSGGTASTIVTVTGGPIAPDSWTFNANSQSYIVSGHAVNFGNATTFTNDASPGLAI